MGEQWDETKGKVKEKLGKLTDDRKTEAEGRAEQGKGESSPILEDSGEPADDAA